MRAALAVLIVRADAAFAESLRTMTVRVVDGAGREWSTRACREARR